MKFTPVRLSPTLRASCMPIMRDAGFQGCVNSWECVATSAARTMLRLGLSMATTLYQCRVDLWNLPVDADQRVARKRRIEVAMQGPEPGVLLERVSRAARRLLVERVADVGIEVQRTRAQRPRVRGAQFERDGARIRERIARRERELAGRGIGEAERIAPPAA